MYNRYATWTSELQVRAHQPSASNFDQPESSLAISSVRVLVAEDFEPFRRFVASITGEQTALQIVCEVSDGLDAVQKAEELQPDLILLDIGLPRLNGIEAARRIHKLAPDSRILFLTQETSISVVQTALTTGALGYVVKTDAVRELLPAIETVLRGEQFVGSRFAKHVPADATDLQVRSDVLPPPAPTRQKTAVSRHEALFYSDNAALLSRLAPFIGTTLEAGNAAIVVATEPHRDALLSRLHAQGLDVGAAIHRGRYIALDAADALSAFMLNGTPDPARVLKLLGNLVMTAAKALNGERGRVALFGECVRLLCAQGNAQAAIQMEELGNQLAETYPLDILCGYPLELFRGEKAAFRGDQANHIFQRICAQHSTARISSGL